MKKIIKTHSADETIKIAEEITKKLIGKNENTIIFLEGELGAGKTTFVKGIANALKTNETAVSPTFTFIKEYEGILPLYHFDLYRIENPEELDEIGFLEYIERKGIIVIEWAEKVEKIIEPNIKVTIKKTGEKDREICIDE